jgi:creatinine amidohydrolase
MMLRIRPDLVGNLSQLAAVSFDQGFSAAYRAWTTRDRTAEGHIGEPAAATAEKGETLFRVFTEDVVALMERILTWEGDALDS